MVLTMLIPSCAISDWLTVGDIIDVVYDAMHIRYGEHLAPFCTALVMDIYLYAVPVEA